MAELTEVVKLKAGDILVDIPHQARMVEQVTPVDDPEKLRVWWHDPEYPMLTGQFVAGLRQRFWVKSMDEFFGILCEETCSEDCMADHQGEL